MTYRQIVDFCYEFTKRNSKANDVAKELGISENSANTWFKFLCQVSYMKILALKEGFSKEALKYKFVSFLFY